MRGVRAGHAVAERRGVGQGLLQPVLAGLVPVVIVQVAAGGLLQQCVRNGQGVTRPAAVDRDLDERPGQTAFIQVNGPNAG